jgi:hypothetical protein
MQSYSQMMLGFRKTVQPTLAPDKLELIDFAFSRFNPSSFADLGGAWMVDGGYTFYALDKYPVERAVLVDTHPTDPLISQAHRRRGLRLIRSNFGDTGAARDVGHVDVIFLFDVLLHQAAPDWDRVLEMYAERTRCFLIYNPQWVGPGRSVRLLDLGEKGYFGNVPCGPDEIPYNGLFQKLEQKHPDHGRKWKDVHPIWQWGITDADLIAKLGQLGFRLHFMKNCRPFGTLENFESHSFIFAR